MPSLECSDLGSYSKKTHEVLDHLGSSMDGLSSEDAAARLTRLGPNEIPKVRRSFLRRMAPQIFDFVILLLIVIAVVLAILAFAFPDNESTSFETSIVILAVIFLSWIMIVIQMFSAERSLESLRKISSARAKVKRDGRWIDLSTSDLVPGDIVRLGEGDRVPADTRLLRSDHLYLDESSLTGESVSVEKDPHPVDPEDSALHQISNTAFMSTIVTKGACEGVVVCTGLNTELGKIAKSISEAPEPAIPLQRKMSQLGKTLSFIMLIMITFLLLFQVLRSLLKGELTIDLFIEELINAVILSVVAVPWSFPIITTSVMARGMTYLVKDNAIVRKIASIEGLGRVSVICSDKTGTMTQNAMTVKTVFNGGSFLTVKGNGYSPEGALYQGSEKMDPLRDEMLSLLIESGNINNDSKLVEGEDGWRVLGDPTEGALRTLFLKAGMKEADADIIHEIPFDSDRKRMTKVIIRNDKALVFTKGGFEVILDRCDRIVWGGRIVDLTDQLRDRISKANDIVNGRAQRTLAFATKELNTDPEEIQGMSDDEVESKMVMLGFVGMIDPPKKGVREAVLKCMKAGIRVVMITGDSKGTATAIARDLCVLAPDDIVLEGDQLPVDRETLKKVSVFCRVSPQQKVDIVKAYQKEGQIIAMTGDGMNDAAALKNADVGVAMGKGGVDVAKEASQIVLSDDNFATLVTAIHRGRQIFDNIRKSITYQMYTNIGELSLMFLGALIFAEQMMSDRQLLFLYFSTHLFPVAALVLDKTTPGVMKEPPRRPDEGIISKKVIGNLSVMIITMASISLLMYLALVRNWIDIGVPKDDLAVIQTMILSFVVWAECFNLFNSLSMKDSLGKQVRERNMLLPVLMVSVPIAALTILIYAGNMGSRLDIVRLKPLQYIFSIVLATLIIPLVELYKIYIRWSLGKETRIHRFIQKGWDIGMDSMMRINDMPGLFQKELDDFTSGTRIREGAGKVGSGIVKAARSVPGRMGIRSNKKKR